MDLSDLTLQLVYYQPQPNQVAQKEQLIIKASHQLHLDTGGEISTLQL